MLGYPHMKSAFTVVLSSLLAAVIAATVVTVMADDADQAGDAQANSALLLVQRSRTRVN